jgi:hypothetical protein
MACKRVLNVTWYTRRHRNVAIEVLANAAPEGNTVIIDHYGAFALRLGHSLQRLHEQGISCDVEDRRCVIFGGCQVKRAISNLLELQLLRSSEAENFYPGRALPGFASLARAQQLGPF